MSVKMRSDIVINKNGVDLATLEDLIKLIPVELWSGNSSSGNITLNDSTENYSCIEIFYTNRLGYSSVKVLNPNGKSVNLITGNGESMEGYFYQNSTKLAISGNSLRRTNDRLIQIQSGQNPTIGTNISYYTLTITKVLGYK